MKRFSIILLGALAILMAGCSKSMEPVSSPDPDAWMYDVTIPVPILFSSGNMPATKADPINSPAEMVGKEFGFFATHDKMTALNESNGLEMPQNVLGTCQLVDGKDQQTVQFNFADGPFYYPQTSVNNYTFYGYHARVTENVSPQTDSIVVVTEVGKTDILWAKAEAEPFELPNVGSESPTKYEGFNARYIRKSQEVDADEDGNPDGEIKHPFMTFKHLTSCVTFRAMTEFSAYAEQNPGMDRVRITKVTVLNTMTRGRLIIAHKNEAREGTFVTIRNGDVSTETACILSEEAQELTVDPFFIAPTDKIRVKLDYDVLDDEDIAVKHYSSEYDLAPEVKEGPEQGNSGFFAGYKYSYNFIVYTPERITIEATVDPYESAFGEGVYEDVYPENE